jgi:hypothetical protein
MTILHVVIAVGLVVTHAVAFLAGAKHASTVAKVAAAAATVVADAKKV